MELRTRILRLLSVDAAELEPLIAIAAGISVFATITAKLSVLAAMSARTKAILTMNELYVTGRKLTYSKSTIARNPDLFRVQPVATDQPQPRQRRRAQNPVVQRSKKGVAVRIVFVVLCGRFMDRANLAHSLKSYQDAVCESLKIDDHDEGTGLSIEYHQIKSATRGVITHITTTETKKTTTPKEQK